MMESSALAAIILVVFIIMTGAIWKYGYEYGQQTGWTRKGINRLAFFIGTLGIATSVYAFVVDRDMRVTTLHEEFVLGSMGLQVNAVAPIRNVTFDVEHTGVEHKLFVCPSRDFGQATSGDATVSVMLLDGDKNTIIKVKEVFQATRDGWSGKTYHFTPRVTGQHTIIVSPLTIGIPKIQVRVTDSEKTDGKRPPGY